MVYVGTYALIYLHTILGDSNGEGIVSRDGLPRGVLPIGISKMQNIVQALKFYAQLWTISFIFDSLYLLFVQRLFQQLSNRTKSLFEYLWKYL